MTQSEIRFVVELDDKRLPDKIFWSATENPQAGLAEAKAIAISVWDNATKESLRIDLWTKDMQVLEMKRFMLDTLGGMALTLKEATSDDYMVAEMELLCEKMVEHLKREYKKSQQ